MKARHNFMKKVLGCIGLGGLVGTGIIEAENSFPVESQNIVSEDSGWCRLEEKIQIEYLYIICGQSNPISFRHRSDKDAFPDMYEAPFVIHWGGFTGTRKGCPMGNIEILIKDFEDKIYLVKNLDIIKLTDWIIQQLTICPISVRTQKYAVNEKAWVARLSPDTVKLLQKDG